jgi:DNA primase
MGIEKLLQDYGIPHVTESEHHHGTPDWINIHCPFCTGSKNFHLGINIYQPMVSHCWRCGGHSTASVLSRILNISVEKAKNLIQEYAGPTGTIRKKAEEPRVSIFPIKFPQPYFEHLNEAGKKYLEGRGFDPEKLEKRWKLKQTGPISFLDKIQYGNRIIIPIYWRRQLVSFQTRDITEKSNKRYLACPMKREVIQHKHIVYGKEKEWSKYPALIMVEGVVDVWKLGTCAVATFGTSFTMEQVLALSRIHNKFFIVYDNEPQAQQQARKLAVKLKALGKKVFIETVDTDPGDMKLYDARHFVKTLLKEVF